MYRSSMVGGSNQLYWISTGTLGVQLFPWWTGSRLVSVQWCSRTVWDRKEAPPTLSTGSVGILGTSLHILGLMLPSSVEKATRPQEIHQLIIPKLEPSINEWWSRLLSAHCPAQSALPPLPQDPQSWPPGWWYVLYVLQECEGLKHRWAWASLLLYPVEHASHTLTIVWASHKVPRDATFPKRP